MESFTRINVARRVAGEVNRFEHFFHVEIPRHHESNTVSEVRESLKHSYPAPDYKIDVTYWDIRGTQV